MNFEPVIGLEIHVQTKTKSKMFSPAPNAFSSDMNSHVSPFDMAFPGTMPTVNKQAVIHAIRVANALHMSVDRKLRFDRKNYFYPDTPKGYQITQQFHPIGKEGYLEILDSNGKPKVIRIERLHMEEDSAKQLHCDGYTLLDYNRCGVPLLEIVSLPDIRSGAEAAHYVEAIRNIVVYSHASDGKMEEGSLRCDVNISLRPYGDCDFGTKVEIKNINSVKNVELAIDYEISRQSALLLSGKPISRQTRRFDDNTKTTIAMREKTDAVDYKYFPESNIVSIHLSERFVEDAISSCPELYDSKKKRYEEKGLSTIDAEILLSDIGIAEYFENAAKTALNFQILAKFVIVEVNGYLNKHGCKIDSFPLSPALLADIANMQSEGYTHHQCLEVMDYLLDYPGENIEKGKVARGIEKMVVDDAVVVELVCEALDESPKIVADYKAGNARVLGFLVGAIMKKAKGKVNPADVARVLAVEINKR